MTFQVTITTKRLLRKPLVEIFTGAWQNEDEVRVIIARVRPHAKIIEIKEQKPEEKNREEG